MLKSTSIPGSVFYKAWRAELAQSTAKQARARRVILALSTIRAIGVAIAKRRCTKELWENFRLLESTMSKREVTLVKKIAVKRGYVQ
jgi:hypothetical protein